MIRLGTKNEALSASGKDVVDARENTEADSGTDTELTDSAAETETVEDVAGLEEAGVDQAGLEEAAAEAEPAEDVEVEEGTEVEAVGDDTPDASGSENPLDSEAEIAADYLEELLDIVDLDGDIDTYLEGGRAHVSIVTESRVLVGSNGEVLDALQELTRLAVMTEPGDRSRLMLDIAGYRDQRRQELVTLTADAVQEVKDSGGKVALAPMNPFERKIVHDAVAAAGLTSESEGEEPKRRVVIS